MSAAVESTKTPTVAGKVVGGRTYKVHVPVVDLKPDSFVGVHQAAEYLEVSYQTMRSVIRRGLVRSLEVTPGHFRMRKRWLDEYVEAEATGGTVDS